MTTAYPESSVRLRPPLEALKRLVQIAPSDRALAAVLGTDNHSVASWRKGTRRMRRPYVVLLPCMDAVVERLAAAGLEDADIVHLLNQAWPELGSKRPAELLKEGMLKPVLEAVPAVTGRAVLAARESKEVARPAWKLELREELVAALAARSTGEPLYEDFVFIRGFTDAEASAFASAAEAALVSAQDEQTWERFLAPYWAAFRLPERPAPAVFATRTEYLDVDENELDELMLPVGAMVSARYPRLA